MQRRSPTVESHAGTGGGARLDRRCSPLRVTVAAPVALTLLLTATVFAAPTQPAHGVARGAAVERPGEQTPGGTGDTASPRGFRPTVPVRLLDTRTGVGVDRGAVGPNQVVDVPMTTSGGPSSVPAGARSVTMNLTVTSPTADSAVTVWPAGAPRPDEPSLAFAARRTVPTLLTVPLGASGVLALHNARGHVHLVADVVGYGTDDPSEGGSFEDTVPVRLLDTRTGGGPIGDGATLPLDIASHNSVPAGATAAVLDVTGLEPTSTSHLTVWPKGHPRPQTSVLNLVPGRTAANRVLAMVGEDGSALLWNASGEVHLVIDLVGYYRGPDAPGTTDAAGPLRRPTAALDHGGGQSLLPLAILLPLLLVAAWPFVRDRY